MCNMISFDICRHLYIITVKIVNIFMIPKSFLEPLCNPYLLSLPTSLFLGNTRCVSVTVY